MELNREQIEESIGYIDDVLENWEQWQTHHSKLTNAMKDLISFAKKLTEENKSLTETVKVRGETIEKLQIFVTDISEDNRKLTEENENAREKNKWLNEENERLKSVEFTYGFIKPHKVLECPIFDEVERTKADTIEELKLRFAMRFGTYTDKDMTPITEVFRLLEQFSKEEEIKSDVRGMVDQIAKEMLEGEKGETTNEN